ncbi:hypothetical protein [Aliamphritea ceti]|uniref:hypothetical protein n=1 Tax=Aliamphritea ceti TaxID=1524258 RepID=UPI0021C3EB9C|nr:hypothetical protein [Aliamphritea ceti]
MKFILREGEQPELLTSDTDRPLSANEQLISSAEQLLALYRDTDTNQPLYSQLQYIRDQYLEDLDTVETRNDIYGLIFWLLFDKNISYAGESLEETADRLSDLDIDSDTDAYTEVIFHLKDAVDRLYELELDED